MASGNGSASPLKLTGREPVIGQPQIVGATVLAVVKCPCGTHPITLVSQFINSQWLSMQVACVLCQTPYAIQDVAADPQGRLTFNLAVGAKPVGVV
jgi:hypothetical protein